MEWTGAKYADKPTVEVEAWVDAVPERVWSIVSDVRLMPEMSQELQAAEWCDGAEGAAAVGRRFVGRSKHDALGEWETTSHVVECDEPRVFTWAVHDAETPTALWRFTLEPENGGTKLRQWMQLGPGRSGLSLAIDQMPDKEEKIVFVRLREFEKAMTGTLAAIKERAEAGGA
ncbi:MULTISPECIES: SRPBCC family protein [Amycolatopsis]|uniref:SRPBCC family protein n=1 Tax=Amycolatopsis TaxID=1813 RepID=UPI00366B7010